MADDVTRLLAEADAVLDDAELAVELDRIVAAVAAAAVVADRVAAVAGLRAEAGKRLSARVRAEAAELADAVEVLRAELHRVPR